MGEGDGRWWVRRGQKRKQREEVKERSKKNNKQRIQKKRETGKNLKSRGKRKETLRLL